MYDRPSTMYSRHAQELNMQQIQRFVNSGMTMKEFMSQPYEAEMSALMAELMAKHELKVAANHMFPAAR